MKRQIRTIVSIALIFTSISTFAQDGSVRTVFKRGVMSSGGYGAVTNQFTTIRGKFANISGLYGGWFINHRFMIGAALASTTNNVHVPQQYSADPLRSLSYEYGQFGLMTEYVVASDKPVHLVFNLFSGAGFTLQYERNTFHNTSYPENVHDQNWFFVAEPGVQVEMNLFKWMRVSPGISYRRSFGSNGIGLDDKDISGLSYSATLKFGKF
jgi:hypothetical protein